MAEMLSAALDQPSPDNLKSIAAYQAISKKLTQAFGHACSRKFAGSLIPFGYTDSRCAFLIRQMPSRKERPTYSRSSATKALPLCKRSAGT